MTHLRPSISIPLGTCLIALGITIQSVYAHGPARAETDTDRAIQFPDIEGHQTLVIDLHTHTSFSDGHVWPKIRMEEALRDGLDAIAVTEHLEYQPHLGDIPHEDRNRAYEISVDAAKESDLIVIPGSEITRQDDAGHMNAVFISDANKLIQVDNPPQDPHDTLGYYQAAAAWPAQNAVDAAHAQGAFIFWNHPFWSAQSPDAITRMNAFHEANIKAGRLHGIEVANGQVYSEETHAIALKYDLALIGVSDVHDLIDWDYEPHKGGHRPVNLVFTEERSAAAIKEALFAKRTVIWFRNLLIGRAPEINALLKASLSITQASYRLGTMVADVTITNRSDADMQLKNTSELTFMEYADHITVPAHGELTIGVKPGKLQKSLSLNFEVHNALVAPKQSASITLTASITPPTLETAQ
ncbi:MAG: Sb-PDE family phosphodiesterase [Pseudomonadota bacterium]